MLLQATMSARPGSVTFTFDEARVRASPSHRAIGAALAESTQLLPELISLMADFAFVFGQSSTYPDATLTRVVMP